MATKSPPNPKAPGLYQEPQPPAHTLPADQRAALEKKQKEAPAQPASLLDQILEQTSTKLDGIADRYREQIDNPALGRLSKAMMTAEAVEQLYKAITPDFMRRVMKLMNRQYGFLTDRDPSRPRWNRDTKRMDAPEAYGEDVVKDCFVESLLRGAHLDGNEWNIIAGKCYLTQAYFYRRIIETKGVTDFKPAPGIPYQHNGRTAVRFAATWKKDGRADQLMGPDGKPGLPIAVISQESTSVDAIVGKAARKAYKRILEQITGTACTEEADDSQVDPTPEPAADEARENLKREEWVARFHDSLNAAQSRQDVATLETELLGQKDWLGPRWAELAAECGKAAERLPHVPGEISE